MFRFKTQAFNHSDCCLVQDVSHQRWLLRATLPTLYFRSCDLGEAVQLVTMKSEIQHENIKQLQRAVRSAFGDKVPQKGALVDVVQVGGRHRGKHSNDMELVLDALRKARKGQGHPLASSFMEACRRNCSCERPELPFTITKELNSFAVVKEYIVKLDDRCVPVCQCSHQCSC